MHATFHKSLADFALPISFYNHTFSDISLLKYWKLIKSYHNNAKYLFASRHTWVFNSDTFEVVHNGDIAETSDREFHDITYERIRWTNIN